MLSQPVNALFSQGSSFLVESEASQCLRERWGKHKMRRRSDARPRGSNQRVMVRIDFICSYCSSRTGSVTSIAVFTRAKFPLPPGPVATFRDIISLHSYTPRNCDCVKKRENMTLSVCRCPLRAEELQQSLRSGRKEGEGEDRAGECKAGSMRQ